MDRTKENMNLPPADKNHLIKNGLANEVIFGGVKILYGRRRFLRRFLRRKIAL